MSPVLLHDFFSAARRRWPDQVAIDIPPGRGRPERVTLTYAEVEAAADALAAVLRPLVSVDRVVAIQIPRTSPGVYVAQLAVLKAGGAFTCLDPAFPPARVDEILADSCAVALLTAGEDGIVVTGLTQPEAPVPPADPGPSSLAYVIYTSGTTGRPKGVMIEHGSIANLVASDLAYFGLGPNDRVIQGSSTAYDSSQEEIWLALASGGTLVLMDDETARLGPDLVPWLCEERATVFCPPPTLLRATGCADPQAALPDLKLLYVGGEALPLDIAAAWSRGRRMVNGYGPTECTVTCLRSEICAGEPVAIGAPVSGAFAWALDEFGNEVEPGDKGELHIGGIGLARGYLGSPEQTAAKFIAHPRLGRIYRTGDLVERAANGEYYYHGRIDAQVKLRGYRIELEEIEARLAELSGVRAAACRVQDYNGVQALVGFVVPENPNLSLGAEDLRRHLSSVLPGYMIPRRIEVLDSLPTTIGGKLDRAKLPVLEFAEPPSGDAGVRPRTPMEARIEAAVCDILERPGGVSVTDDFFDLGGDSLTVALLVTLLRDDPETEWVTVSDIYDARTVAELAARADVAPRTIAREESHQGLRRGQNPGLTALVQAGWLAVVLLAGSYGAWAVSFILLPQIVGSLGLTAFILLAPLLSAVAFAIYVAASAVLAIVVKRLLIGAYTARRSPIWGGFYIRHWIVVQTVRLVPWRLIEGTSIQQTILRALGARIGRRVHIHRRVELWRGGWDLLDIGDDVTLSQEAMLRLVELDRGDIVVAPISLGAGVTVETRAGLAGDTAMGAGSRISALSSLPPGGRIPAGEFWDGVPARSMGKASQPPPFTSTSHEFSPVVHGVLTLLAEGTLGLVIALPVELAMIAVCRTAGIDEFSFWRWMYHPSADPAQWALLLAGTILAVPVTLVWSAALSRWLGPVRPGVISLRSLGYIRVWLKTWILGQASEWLSGTLFWPSWLRMAGMKIGKGSEISTIIDVVPELVGIGGGTFFADGIYLGGPRISQGTVSLARTELGANTFLGNHVVISSGQSLPDDILIGISTPADAARIRQGTSWFGHPSFELPRREIVAVDRSLTHDPSLIRYVDRMFWEALRFFIPIIPLLTTIAWFVAVGRGTDLTSGSFFGLWLPMVSLAAAAGPCLLVLALKWLLLGRVKPGQHALWSCWCSRWDFLYVVWGKVARPMLELLEGSIWLTLYLRAIGMKIGKRVAIGPGFAQVVDPDMLTLDDDSTVNAVFQAHTFEDRVLKIDHVTVGKGSTLSAATVPLYGAVVGEDCWVGPHSVIMKQEHLLPARRYEGVPTRG